MVSSSLKSLRLKATGSVLSANQIEAVDPLATFKILCDLLQLPEKRNFLVLNALTALKNTLHDPRFHERLGRLDKAIYNLDYKKPISVVSQLIRKVDMTLKKEWKNDY
jgi:hypothetical protein